MVAAVLAALVNGGYRVWRKLEQDRLLARAESLAEQGDLHNAALSAQRALQKNPVSIPANRLMGEIAERWRSPNAFFGRAATTASASVGAPVALAELLDGWEGWSEDLRTFLWRVAEIPAERSWALRSLFQFHAQRMDTAGLLRVSFSWRNNRHPCPRLRRPMNSPPKPGRLTAAATIRPRVRCRRASCSLRGL